MIIKTNSGNEIQTITNVKVYGLEDSVKASKKMLDMCHVKYTQYVPTGKKIELNL